MGCYRPDLTVRYFNLAGHNFDWSVLLQQLPEVIPEPEQPVWLLVEDSKNYLPKYWLYEGYLPEISLVLAETAHNDFYLISKKLAWLISVNHHDVLSCVGAQLKTEWIDLKHL